MTGWVSPCIRQIEQMRKKSASLQILVCLFVLLVAQIDGAYEIVDTVTCANLLDSITLDENLVDIQTNPAYGRITYNVSSMSVAERKLFRIGQTKVTFSESNDVRTEIFASQLLRKYRLMHITTTTPAKSVIGALIFINVKFHNETDYNSIELKSGIELAVQKTNLTSALVTKKSSELASITVDECSWFTTRRYNQTMLVCGVLFRFNKCVYVPFQQNIHSLEHMNWLTNLLSLMLGMGNLFFTYDLEKTQKAGGTLCENVDAKATVRGFPFKLCENMEMIATCFDEGVPCDKAQSEQNMNKFWNVYSIINNEDPSVITARSIKPVVGMPGDFIATFTLVHMITHRTAYTDKDMYFKNSIQRPCFLGQIPRKMVVSEQGFFYVATCQPCMLNTYYTEHPTPRTSITEDDMKTKTLILGLVSNSQDSAMKAYYLVESKGTDTQWVGISRGDPPADLSIGIAGGTTVTINVDNDVIFDGIRGPSGVQFVSTVENGATTVTIKIPIIYGEDSDDADAPIFIDVHTNVPTNVTNEKFLAILPIRHPMLQTCTPCPDDFVTKDYGSTSLSACVKFEGARRANISTTFPAIINTTTKLLDSIADFQLRQVVSSDETSRVQVFMETTAQMAILHKERIQLDVARFFGMQAQSNTTFSFGLADLRDVNTLPSSVLPGPVRRLLQAGTGSGAAVMSPDIVGISMQVNRGHVTTDIATFTTPPPSSEPDDANSDILYTVVAIVILVIFLVCLVTLALFLVYAVCIFANKPSSDGQDPEHHPFLQQPAVYENY